MIKNDSWVRYGCWIHHSETHYNYEFFSRSSSTKSIENYLENLDNDEGLDVIVVNFKDGKWTGSDATRMIRFYNKSELAVMFEMDLFLSEQKSVEVEDLFVFPEIEYND